jgi:hypothetical protein
MAASITCKNHCTISSNITCPLWCVLEVKSVTITDMNARYLEMVTYMEDALNNLDKFVW